MVNVVSKALDKSRSTASVDFLLSMDFSISDENLQTALIVELRGLKPN